MSFLVIVAGCILAAVAYGILHDQVTVRVCVEYFTIGHPPVFATDDPTVLALGWGVLATWWVGAILGVALALAARGGSRPKRTVRSLPRPVVKLLFLTAAAALCAGVVGWCAASRGWVVLVGPLASEVPPERHTAFLADLWAHTACYLFGFAGGIVVCVRVWRSRCNPAGSTR